ncbi:solute carrier family 35 member B1-like isoform X2 [Watersipora subatra]|uniref:solute carrier family 35 member B1-like isoform X2 n=1 Tax=Watersipora subatra TaxID=2589382 RepID=UPI00355BB51B
MLEKATFLFYAAGIFICYFFYGILQEKITKGEYVREDGSKEFFTFSLSLVFLQCIINCIFAAIVKRVKGGRDETDTTTAKLYALCSMSYLGAMLASNKSLQWVSYPTQVLGKSAKPIPVMVMGVLFASKRYPLAKYFFVLLITAGVALFIYKDSKVPEKGVDTDHTFGIGEILLIVSLLCDGATGVLQSKMRQGHTTKSYDMMLNMNLWSLLWLAIALSMGEAYDFILFASRNPHVLTGIIIFGLSSALGQHFIFLMVSTYGPLPCSIATTTRKFFTILASVIVFGHTLLYRQWIGTAFVFTGLGLDIVFGKEIKPDEKPPVV